MLPILREQLFLVVAPPLPPSLAVAASSTTRCHRLLPDWLSPLPLQLAAIVRNFNLMFLLLPRANILSLRQSCWLVAGHFYHAKCLVWSPSLLLPLFLSRERCSLSPPVVRRCHRLFITTFGHLSPPSLSIVDKKRKKK